VPLKKLVFLFLWSTGFFFAQNPYSISIDKTSGLSSNSVYDIFQDSKGFMWFATVNGLNKFDGNFSQTFTPDFQTSKSGSCIQEDEYGRIWYENFDGFLYYVENGKLKALEQSKPIGYFRYGLTKKHLQVVERDGVRFYDLKTLRSVKKIPIKFNLLQFVFSADEKLYIFDELLYEVDQFGNTKSFAYPKDFQREFVSPIVQKKENGIVIISKFANYYYYFEKGKFTKHQFKFPVEFIQNLATTKNALWLCTTKGITQINTKTEEFTNYFSQKNISYLYQDRQNNYWVSTLNEGVFFIGNLDTKIIELPSKPTLLRKAKNNIIVGVENDALYSVNPKTNAVTSLYNGNLNHVVSQLFHEEETGNHYLTSSNFKVITPKKTQELRIGAVKSIAKIDGKYFSFAASSVSGIFTLNDQLKSDWDKVFKNYDKITEGNFSRTNIISYSNGKSTIYNPLNQTIYYATNNGLMAFTKQGSSEIKYNQKTIYFTKIFYYNGVIYGFSSNDQIFTINSKNEIKPYQISQINESQKIEKIVLHDHLLFVFTSDAINEINLETKNFRKIISLSNDILISDVLLLNGTYYFASSKGIIIKNNFFNPSNNEPQLFINEIKVNNQKIIPNQNAQLSHTENDIKISFTVLSPVPHEKYKVLYSVNNSKWNVLDVENRNLILSALSPNDYEIKFKIDDQKMMDSAVINFTIEKPFWLNPIVLSIAALLILLSFWMVYKLQIAKIKRNNQLVLDKINLEKNVNHAKLMAIKSQMNPHFFYNALNTLQSYILSNEKNNALNYLSKFSNLTRTILEMTGKDYITIKDEINTLTLYLDLEKARFEKDFTYSISLVPPFADDSIKIPTMLLQPYIENALKHGLLHKTGKKELKIIFEITDAFLKITIDDNGIGRLKSAALNRIKNKKHRSFATEATQNRINLLNQYTHRNITVNIIDKYNPIDQSLGTTVIFKIPLLD